MLKEHKLTNNNCFKKINWLQGGKIQAEQRFLFVIIFNHFFFVYLALGACGWYSLKMINAMKPHEIEILGNNVHQKVNVVSFISRKYHQMEHSIKKIAKTSILFVL